MNDDELATRYRESVRGETPTRGERDLAHSLAGVVAIGKTIKSPAIQKAALEGLLDLCGLNLALLRRTSDLEKRAASLEAKTKELEARAIPKYLGVWRAGMTYSEGSLLTHDGSLWHANKSTDAKPGGHADWTLCVKRGKDLTQ